MTITGENITLTKKELSSIMEEAFVRAAIRLKDIYATPTNTEEQANIPKKSAEMTEFEEKTIIKYGEHWDIGQTWM